jgi:hypothetical protein
MKELDLTPAEENALTDARRLAKTIGHAAAVMTRGRQCRAVDSWKVDSEHGWKVGWLVSSTGKVVRQS